jgi:hypothetical protein
MWAYNSTSFFYECEISSVTVREESRLRLFDNRVMSEIIGPKSGEKTRGCGRLCKPKIS